MKSIRICDCSNVATIRKCGQWVCHRCDQIERSRMMLKKMFGASCRKVRASERTGNEAAA